jgi:hypothetical protein
MSLVFLSHLCGGERVHHHIGGLEIIKRINTNAACVHHHIGGLEKFVFLVMLRKYVPLVFILLMISKPPMWW